MQFYTWQTSDRSMVPVERRWWVAPFFRMAGDDTLPLFQSPMIWIQEHLAVDLINLAGSHHLIDISLVNAMLWIIFN